MPMLPKRLTTGLRRGDVPKIARVHRCAENHVRLVALGQRHGRAALTATIERYQQKAMLAAARVSSAI